MSLHRDLDYRPLTDPEDPDDWRPGSVWALISEQDANVTVIAEKIGVGDAIPFHVHRIDEVIVYLSGEAEVRVGDEIHAVRGGDIVIIPAGKIHGTRNTGTDVVEIRAVFPTARIDIQYVERNPAPGTESDPPQPGVILDTHTGAVAPLTDDGD